MFNLTFTMNTTTKIPKEMSVQMRFEPTILKTRVNHNLHLQKKTVLVGSEGV